MIITFQSILKLITLRSKIERRTSERNMQGTITVSTAKGEMGTKTSEGNVHWVIGQIIEKQQIQRTAKAVRVFYIFQQIFIFLFEYFLQIFSV